MTELPYIASALATAGEIFHVTLRGEIDISCRDGLSDLAADFEASSALHVVVDLSEVRFMDSSGLAGLIRLYRLAGDRGGTLRVLGVQDEVRRLLRLTGLEHAFITGQRAGLPD